MDGTKKCTLSSTQASSVRKVVALLITLSMMYFANANEIKSFMGVEFGAPISEGKFEGPDEDGDYTFLPEGAIENPFRVFIANVTHSSKRIYGVSIVYVLAESEVAEVQKSCLAQFKQAFGADWSVPTKLERAMYYNEVKTLGVASKDYVVYLFKNDAGETCQIFQMITMRDSGMAKFSISITDAKLSELDDAEKSGKTDEPMKLSDKQGAKHSEKSTPKAQDGQREPSGDDIIKNAWKKENGYTEAQLKKISKQYAGRTLTFSKGKVSNVSSDDDDITVTVAFPKSSFDIVPFSVYAHIKNGEMSRIAEDLDEETKVKSITGEVVYPSEYDPDVLNLSANTIVIKNAKFVIEE